MSPSRRRRQVVPHRRSRAEIVKAVAAGVGIVAATALVVWLMRPGPAGVPATGGLINRQPRSSWLIFLAVGLALLATWWILRGSRRLYRRAKVVLPITLGAILVVAVVAGFAWPGGLLRHDVAPPPVTTPTSQPATSTTHGPSTTGSTTTSAKGGTSTSGAPSTTSVTTTPTTRAPATPTT